MSLDLFLDCAGPWQGASTLQDPETGNPDHSESRAVIIPVLHDRFIRIDYNWSYKGKLQEGSMLIAHDPATTQCSLYWADTWHMGHGVMACAGTLTGATLSARGTYAAPSGPDWGWRIDLVCTDAGEIRLTMYNATPDGVEERAVDAVYTRG